MSWLLICFPTSPHKHPSVSVNHKMVNAAPLLPSAAGRGVLQAEQPQRTPLSPYGGPAQPPALPQSLRGQESKVLPFLDGQCPLLDSRFARSLLHAQKPLLAFPAEQEIFSISSRHLPQAWKGFIETSFPIIPSHPSRLLVQDDCTRPGSRPTAACLSQGIK